MDNEHQRKILIIVLSLFEGIQIGERKFEFKLFAITGDIPALNLILNFTGHTGYFACHHCFLRGVHQGNKRQYPYDPSARERTPDEFIRDASLAAALGNQHGHLGPSILSNHLDCPMPYSILIDYAHTSLLRHGKLILSNLYSLLRPTDRQQLDDRLINQPFPHFFHRKLRRLNDLSFIKATEVRNLLFYALIPLLIPLVSIDLLSHIALFITAIRLLHCQSLFGKNTPHVAHELFIRYYNDIDRFFPGQLNLTLHNHTHFKKQYQRFGSLSHTGSFGQESLIGYVADNSYGTRFFGDNICHQYSIDYALNNYNDKHHSLIDPEVLFENENSFDFSSYPNVMRFHQSLCSCQFINNCLSGFKRYRCNGKCFHSLSYGRRQKSVSYFIRYKSDRSADYSFGKIVIFLAMKKKNYCLVQVFPVEENFSTFFRHSKSYFLLQKPLDRLFYRVSSIPLKELDIVSVEKLIDHVIVFDQSTFFIVTPVSSYNEHN